jgi:hypothetical protein
MNPTPDRDGEQDDDPDASGGQDPAVTGPPEENAERQRADFEQIMANLQAAFLCE